MNTIKSLLLAACLILTTLGISQNKLDKIDQLLTEKFKTTKTGAAVLISQHGKPVYRKAFGLANLELNVKMNPANVFEIGSMTKQFTAVSILMLLEQGKLDLQDDITKYIPDYPTKGHKITIHQLLCHSSGIPEYFSLPEIEYLFSKENNPDDFIKTFWDMELEFEPGF